MFLSSMQIAFFLLGDIEFANKTNEFIWLIPSKPFYFVRHGETEANVARQVAMVQINVNVKEKTLTFKSNFFKTADFKFAWAGYSGGNSLGFTMKMSH